MLNSTCEECDVRIYLFVVLLKFFVIFDIDIAIFVHQHNNPKVHPYAEEGPADVLCGLRRQRFQIT